MAIKVNSCYIESFSKCGCLNACGVDNITGRRCKFFEQSPEVDTYFCKYYKAEGNAPFSLCTNERAIQLAEKSRKDYSGIIAKIETRLRTELPFQSNDSIIGDIMDIIKDTLN